jgi:TolA-binding protein
MSDPRRLLDDESTELERLLLRAVERERPGRRLRRRMKIGLGLASSLFTLKAAAAALSVVSVVAGTAVIVNHRSGPAEPAAVLPGPARLSRAVPATTDPESAPVPAPAPRPAETATPSEPPKVVAPATRSSARSAAPDLGEQTRLLDRARSALREGSPMRALEELNRYVARYPKGMFAQEASVLRIQALRESGQGAKASALTRDFIRRHADSPHVESLSQDLEPADHSP